jgi:hypothetical protein
MKAADRELARLLDSIKLKGDAIAKTFADIRNSSRALGDVINLRGMVALRPLDPSRAGAAMTATAGAMQEIKAAMALDKQQDDQKREVQRLRDEESSITDPQLRLPKLKAIEEAMDDRLKTLIAQLQRINNAAETLAPVASFKAMSYHKQFWSSFASVAEEDQPEPAAPVSMRL